MPDPVGYVVACRTTYDDDSGHWVMDSLGMWTTREEAETDKADSLRDNAFDGNEKLFVCAVVPIEDRRG